MTDPGIHEEWLTGRIASGLGEFDQAASSLQSVRSSFLAADLPLDASLVTLDLAELRLAQGHLAAVHTLAQETLSVFEQQEVPAEAARAIHLLARAAATERLSAALLARLRRSLDRRA
ncbi:MAG: hypothetical protein AAF481_09385 [Acidobacteriota bacterium]